jgi:hypothetical protein
MIKLTEAQKTGSTTKDGVGRTIFQTSYIYRDLFVNPEHIISINEEVSNDTTTKLSRIETTRGSFIVVGSPGEIQKEFSSSKKKLLKD